MIPKWKRVVRMMGSQVDLGNIGLLLVVIAGTLILLFLFFKPILKLSQFVLRSLCYSALVFLLNLVTQAFSFTVGVNAVTALWYGLCGIYGVIGSYLLRMIYI